MENAERQIFALGGKKKNVSDPQKTGSEFQLRPGKRILRYLMEFV